MGTTQIVTLILGLLSGLPSLATDAVSFVDSIKSLFTSVQNGTITAANFTASIQSILATASSQDAQVESA